jgi:Flp pilus assembly protein CpaB
MVAVPIPINRFSGLAYGISTGDHVNIIATMAFVDLDTDFQTILPNYTGAVLSPGNNIIITSNPEHLLVGPGADAGSGGEVKTDLIAGDVISNIVAQSATGEFVSPQGRGELDAVLNQPFYLVPSEPIQRPRIVSQTVLFNKLVLHVGNFPVYNEQGQEVEPVTAAEAEAEAQAEQNQNTDQATKTDKTVPNVPDIITLVVSPQEAVTLNYLIYTGAQLTVALRSPVDDTANPTDAVSIQYLLDSYRIPIPVKVPYGFEPATYELAPPQLENDNP